SLMPLLGGLILPYLKINSRRMRTVYVEAITLLSSLLVLRLLFTGAETTILIAYSRTFPEGHDWRDHGRDGAKIAREFLRTLGFDEAQINEICYGIAIHVDDEADFEGERTPLALSVSDADNIDRFDVYRIYDSLSYISFDKMSLVEKTERCRVVLDKLEQFRQMPFGTKSGSELWLEKLDFQVEFFTRLYNQMQNSVFTED
ncbi:MAG: hypothetical protein IKZ30_06975, partial [Oscillospiraceae bacterium]|nr:hypothetical protein [Oscillospiraceae bacterium]